MTKSIFSLKVWVVGCEEAARGRQLLSARGLPAEQSRAASRSRIFLRRPQIGSASIISVGAAGRWEHLKSGVREL
eukprot:COSAG06_NODE_12_length_35417_cov_270.698992_26_plen_75_part_00